MPAQCQSDGRYPAASGANSDPSSPFLTPPDPENKKKRVYKKRKATNTIRKEQKAVLEKEIEALQRQLDEAKLQALAQQGEASYNDQEVENAALRNSIQEQHVAMAQVRALLSGHTQQNMSNIRPMETRICLGINREERLKVLHALRGAKLKEAKRFLCARSHELNPTTPYFQEERCETKDGDFCIARFDITPLCGVKGGVRAVFDAVLQSAFNAEIIISESSGNITVREDDDMNDEHVTQMRLVSQTSSGALLETNLVQFAEFSCHDNDQDGDKDEDGYAIVATDFVDQDELYPYRPRERARRDVTAALLVTSYVKTHKNRNSLEREEGDNERVVVFSRLLCSRICHKDLELSSQAQLELRETSIRYANNFLKCLQQMLGLPKAL
ncbi:hypothetical protein PHYBOEH_007218 [Phytophthora boehmeriae]|uniref:Uncharacterized protein n=1 Tax=Phytophthora boehmeriae TaxID=109152 RepID=A0A8T1WCP7_9STRA|nr:hypothetical protein PHYBOEH_007218 [Phytophthora boehmeriae]